LYFGLGVLSTALIMLIVAPIVWRRAVVLTRRRIESSVPLTVDEILVHKDRLRAEHAMTVRRLELSVKQLRRKVATQLAEIGNSGAQMRALGAEKDDLTKRIAALETELGDGAEEVKSAREDMARLAEQLRSAEATIEERGSQLDELGLEIQAISLTSSNRQVDLAAREADIDRLQAEISAMREQRKELERELRDAKTEARAANEVLHAETRKTGEMGKRIDKLMADLSDREELLDRRQREIERLRERAKETKAQTASVAAAPAGEDSVQSGERLKIVELMSPLVGELEDGNYQKAAKKLSKEIKRDREKIQELEKTVHDLQNRIAARGSGARPEANNANALREQINEIAAEMIHITALLEGADSPINEILAKDDGQLNGKRSLADRVKALQKAADKYGERTSGEAPQA
jgi:chromosome segregation ATPase